MTPSTRHAIFLGLNENFVPLAEIFLKSLARNYPDHPDVYIYSIGLGERSLERLSAFKRVQPVSCGPGDFVAGPPMASHHPNFADPRISYARFLIWTDRFAAYENVLHLDADLLVLGALEELLERKDFTAFVDAGECAYAIFYDDKHPELERLLAEDGIVRSARMANAGVFLVPKKDRTPENHALLVRFLARYGAHIKWADQSVINLWMAKKGYAAETDFRYNFQHQLVDDLSSYRGVAQASVFHLSGVDMAYKLFFMRLAGLACRLPFGWGIYRHAYRTARRMLRAWRNWKPILTGKHKR